MSAPLSRDAPWPSLRSTGIVGRLVLGMCLVATLLFGAYGVWLVRSETVELREDERRELLYIARSLQVAIENAQRDADTADITETLVALEIEDPTLDVTVWTADDEIGNASSGSAAPGELERALVRSTRTSRQAVFHLEEAVGPARMIVALPLVAHATRPPGALLVTRPLAAMDREVAALRRSATTAVVMSVLITGLVGLLLGRLAVGRPLAELVVAIQQVQRGDLRPRLRTDRADEIGQVARAFTDLCAELHTAQARLGEEAAQRVAMQATLQRADKLASVGQLAAMLAHEIASPLQVLTGRADDLASRDDVATELRGEARTIAAQGRRIGAIVERLLGFARRSPGQGASARDVANATLTVAELLRPLFQRKHVALRVVVAPGLPTADTAIHADAAQQIAFNLLNNALAAAPEGSTVLIHVHPTHGEGASGTEHRLSITVEDEGAGVPEALAERVFEPFFTTRQDDGGTGLGLAVVAGIAQSGRGRVVVGSSPSGGARFDVQLPLQERPT